jgi:uncharacterized Zn finger protein
MINIINFEKSINTTILNRGKDYFSNGNVTEVEEIENVWTAEVQGSETYNVEININKNLEVVKFFCSCPYEGMVCKHTVAVFYVIQQEVNKPKILINKKINIFETIIKKVTISEYQDFIRSYSVNNKKFKAEFELYFSEKDGRIDIEAKYLDLFKKIEKKHTDRGFIDYRSSISFSKEVDRLIDTGLEYVKKNNVKDALSLAKAILNPLMKSIENTDDSRGSIGGSIQSAIELIDVMLDKPNIAFDIKEQIFELVKKELNDKIYFDYGDFGYELLSVFEKSAIQLNKSNDFLEHLDIEISKLTGKYDNYRKEYYQKTKISFLREIGRNEEAENIIYQNIDIVDVRLNEVKKHIDKKDYKTAKKLINEGIKIAEEKQHPGTVLQWNKELLQIAIAEKDVKLVRFYTKLFAFDRGFSEDYYKQWKATFNEGDWENEIENYINETINRITEKWKKNSKNDYWYPKYPPIISSELPSIYIAEGYLDRLLILVQQSNSLDITLNFHSKLLVKYPKELIKIYIPNLEDYGLKVSDRNGYIDLVGKMQKIIKDIPDGKFEIILVAQTLKEKFSIKPRRPAMIEELDKILK